MTTKSAAEGSPARLRSSPSSSSSWSKKAGETRTTRRSAPIALAGDDAMFLEQGAPLRSCPGEELRRDLREVGDDPLVQETLPLVRGQPLQLGGRPDPVLSHRSDCTAGRRLRG